MGSALMLVLCLGLIAAAPIEASTLHVNSLADPTEAGKCTLRDAIAAANTNAPSGGCPAGDPGADRIVFDVTGVLQVTGAAMWIRESLDIQGPGADALTLRGPGGDGPLPQTDGLLMFYAVSQNEPSGVFRLAGVTVADGRGLDGAGVTFFGYVCYPYRTGTLTIDRCVFRDNVAPYGSAILAGGIGPSGRLEILDTTITGSNPGGASVVEVSNTPLAMTNTTIATTGAQASVSFSYGSLGCPSSTDRQPLVREPAYSAQMVHCTLAGSDRVGVRMLGNQDFYLPGAVLLTLRGTILAGHVGGNVETRYGSVVTSLGDNLSSDGTGADSTRPDDLLNTDPRLGPLAYDGPVPTLFPLPGSPAIDRIPAGRCATPFDARGAARPLDGNGDGVAACDIGAAEAPGPPLAESAALAPDRDTCDTGTRCGLTAVVTGPSGPLAGRRLTFVATGANPSTGAATSDAAGRAVFSYVGRTTGTDSIQAVFIDANGAPHRSGSASLAWRAPAADLSVSLAVAPALVAPGGTLVHSILLRDAGPSPATDVALDLSLPAGLEVVSLRAPSGWSCEKGGSGARCVATSVAEAASVPIGVVTRLAPTVAAGTTLTATATVSATTPDPEPANGTSTATATVSAGATASTRVVPIVLDATSGAARFTTELTLTNRDSTAVAATLRYTPSLGSREGGGDVTFSLPAGRQLVVPDVLATLRDAGLALPAPSPLIPQGGTLLVNFAGATEPGAVAASARTTTPTRAPQPAGRVGVAYPGIGVSGVAAGTAYVFGLRESDSDRSNVAILNSGADPVTVRVTAVNGAGDGRSVVVREALALAPLGWTQLTRVLEEAGFAQGYVRIERVSAAGSFQTYGIVNTNGTDDGSFVPAAGGARATSVLTVPVVAEFPEPRLSSELVLANKGTVPAALRLTYAESLNPGLGPGGTAVLTLGPGEQRLLPSALDLLRAAGAAVGPRGRAGYAGALRIDVAGADPSDVFAGARTVTFTAAGGPFDLFTPAVPGDATASTEAFVFGLQATGTTRSNVALSNAGSAADGEIELEVQAFDGDADGVARGAARKVRLDPGIWEQIDGPLKDAGIVNGWVRVRRLSGTAPWIAYGVLNDGGSPGERTGDGAYVAMSTASPR